MEIPARKVECDVLIIGGGSAALIAALEARESVERVVVVSKRKPGRSGNTIVAGTGFAACVPEEGNPDSTEQHLRDILSGGDEINDPALARTLVSEGPAAVMDLERYGLTFMRVNGSLLRRMPPDHSRARLLTPVPREGTHATRGLTITLPLLRAAEAKGVSLLSDMPIQRLLVRDGTVCGALALESGTGEPVALLAKSVILAAGGGGRLFSNSNNTLDVTGDSYALALEAGLPLRDMEMVQFYPLNTSMPVHTIVSNAMVNDGAVLRNRHGERFMLRYDPVNGDIADRAAMSMAMFSDVQAGNGVDGSVYLDCSAVPSEALKLKYPTFWEVLRRHSVDLSKQWLPVAPATHFLMGGAWIDPRCRTSVEGLFVAGEAAGGAHGANRLGGNALTETLVYGRRSGREAALHALAVGRVPEPPRALPDLPSPRDGSVALAEVRKELRRAMWDHASIVRTEAGLRRAEATLGECREALARCRMAASEVAVRLELERMVLVGQSIVASALERQESRGAHYRSDYPARDDSRWLGSTRVEKAGEELQVSFVPLKG